ncbi:MAG: CHAT domain-containing protein, partial [Anaerolineaceae bacterium]|nr:CHAT domain-containing protein [Anaerolineaceae bacterium]
TASALPFILAKSGREISNPLVLGNPDTDNPNLPSLDYAALEAQYVAELFGTQPLLKDAATEAALQENVSGAGVVHLAVHGGLNPVAPLFSRLWLAPGNGEDGHLNIHEVYSLDLDATELVVLSACQTQLGQLSAGDEIVSLNRAFLYGVPTVISSLWSVDDEATGELMTRFYNHLLGGKGKAQALQAAQAEIRENLSHPEWAHPYYWAGFVLNGDPGIINAPEPISGPEVTSPQETEDAAEKLNTSVVLGTILIAGLGLILLGAIIIGVWLYLSKKTKKGKS